MAEQKQQQTYSAESQDKGMSVFLDVFRRADKNDDGFISWEEFVSYFSDGVMGKEELQALFNEIDSHNTNNIDVGELCAYFSQHLGEFKEIFGLMEEMSVKLTNVLFGTAKVYKESSRTDQFVSRFLMREISNQMMALQGPLDHATEVMDQQAREDRSDIMPLEVGEIKAGTESGVVPGRVGRRAKRQASNMSTNSSLGGTNPASMTSQLEKLSSLMDKLESKIRFENFRDEEVVTSRNDTILMVQREFIVKRDSLEEFRAQLRSYVDLTQGFRGCRNVSVRDIRPTNSFHVYEVWCDEDHYLQNCGSEATTNLVDKTADFLEKPETVKSMNIPEMWWPQDP